MHNGHYGQAKHMWPPAKPEVPSGEYLVETENYVPLKLQLTTLMAAGQRLRQWRTEAFDFANGIVPDDGYEDPTRRPNFDLADAHEIMQEIETRVTRRRAEKAVAEPEPEPEPAPPEPEPGE